MKVPKPRKLPSGNYFIQLRLDGKSISVTAATAKECEHQAMLLKAQHIADRGKIHRPRTEITVQDAVKKYIADRNASVRPLSPSTERGYLSAMRNYLGSIKDVPLHSVDWQSHINSISQTKSAKTVANVWGLAKSILKHNEIEIPQIVLPKVKKKETNIVEPEDIKKLIAYIKDKPVAIPALLALHSLRKSELMALTWDNGDIDLTHNIIHVRGAVVLDKDNHLVRKDDNKTEGSRRDVPIMIPELFELLKAVEDKTGNVVKCHPNTPYKQLHKACEAIGINKVGTHGMRHTFCSLAFSRDVGMTEQEVMDIGGWSDPQTMRKIYKHLAEKDRLKAQNKMAAFYAEKEKPQQE